MELATFGYPLYLLSFCHPEAGGRTGVFGEGELAVILVHLLCLHLVFSLPTLVVLAIATILKVHILQVVRQIILGGEGEEDGGREGRGREREGEGGVKLLKILDFSKNVTLSTSADNSRLNFFWTSNNQSSGSSRSSFFCVYLD